MNKVKCSESSSGSRARGMPVAFRAEQLCVASKLACFSEMQLRRRSHVSKALSRGLEHCLAPSETRPATSAEDEQRAGANY